MVAVSFAPTTINVEYGGQDIVVNVGNTTGAALSEATAAALAASGGAGLVGYGAGTLEESIIPTAQRYGAAGNNVADDSAALQDAADTGLCFVVPPGTYKSDTAITGEFRAVSYGATFTGTDPLDDLYPGFGPGALKVFARGTFNNAIIGIVHNTAPAGTTAFPCGLTGYGRNDNAGNVVYGVYAEARQHATAGVAVNEIDSFNMTATAPSTALPPNLGIGTTQQHMIGLLVGAGGTSNSSIGIMIAQEGSLPQKFLTGMYLHPSSVTTYGIFLDSVSTSTHVPLVVKHASGQIGVQIQGEGSPVGGNPSLIIYDGNAVERFAFLQSGVLRFSGAIISTTVGVAGAASALPANPSGYMLMNLGGANVKVPFYAE